METFVCSCFASFICFQQNLEWNESGSNFLCLTRTASVCDGGDGGSGREGIKRPCIVPGFIRLF